MKSLFLGLYVYSNLLIVIRATTSNVVVEIEGGVGYVPIRFEGLKQMPSEKDTDTVFNSTCSGAPDVACTQKDL